MKNAKRLLLSDPLYMYFNIYSICLFILNTDYVYLIFVSEAHLPHRIP